MLVSLFVQRSNAADRKPKTRKTLLRKRSYATGLARAMLEKVGSVSVERRN